MTALQLAGVSANDVASFSFTTDSNGQITSGTVNISASGDGGNTKTYALTGGSWKVS